MTSKNDFAAQALGLDKFQTDYIEIPWHFKHPLENLYQWQQKIKNVIYYYQSKAQIIDIESRQVDLLPSTSKRLKLLKNSYQKTALFFNDVLTPLLTSAQKNSNSTTTDNLQVYHEKIPRQQTVMAYHQTVFRDWVWGKSEIEIQTELLLPLLTGAKKLLVLGAGACGLPLSLHNSLKECQTLAVDINPVLFFIVKKLISGEDLNLVEYPTLSHRLEHVAVEHVLKGIATPPRFHMLFADAQATEFKSQFFDSVLTPWFIDIVPRSFRELSRHINQSLQVGGHWVNMGLLAFERNQYSEILSQQEVQEALEDAGFKVKSLATKRIPYLQSPYSAMSRNDEVVIFSAEKVKMAKKPVTYEYLPLWLRDWNTPIPLTHEIQQLQIQASVYAQTAQFVDGKLSLENIAQIFAKEFSMNIDDARSAIHTFFVNVYEQYIFKEFK